MIPLKPSFLTQPPTEPLTAPSNYVQATRFERRPTSSYSHISFFRSLLLDMQIYSPSIKVVIQPGLETLQPRPVFGDQDKIEGKIILDPSCSQSGRLTISLEGIFEYLFVEDNPSGQHPHKSMIRRHRQVFVSSSTSITISPISDSRSTIREALSVRKRPSTSSLNSSACRSCEFGFEFPRGSRPGEEIPPTFSSKNPTGDSLRQLHMEELDVSYRITAAWEAFDGSENQAVLEAPVLFQQDSNFGCSVIEPESWLEMPLISERQIPFSCAVTLPRPQTFSRSSSIPYFVVFTTNTRLPCLIKEIAADATIAVSLIRKITVTSQRVSHSPILPDTLPASDDPDAQTPLFAPRPRPLKRSTKVPALFYAREESFPASKPLPELPRETISVSRTLWTQVFIGFPKRPRPIDTSQNLPDGLYKGKMQLSRDMMPSVDWPGISVKYYLDISVLAGQDDVRARVPIKVY